MTSQEIYNQYTQHYDKQFDRYVYVPLTQAEFAVVSSYAEKAAKLRYGQPGYTGTTLEQLQTSFTLGGTAEAAVLKLLGHSIQDMETAVCGGARDFAHPDLSCVGIDCGVKASYFGYPPLIVSREKFNCQERCGSEIICTITGKNIVHDENGKTIFIKGVWVNGFATPTVLTTYQDRQLVHHQDNEKYKDRCGFYGFEHLFPLNTEKNIRIFLDNAAKKNASEKIFS